MNYMYRKAMRVVVLFLSMLTVYYHGFSQEAPEKKEVNIKGRLTDDQTGEAIIGAFVYIKGTKTGGQTDADGNFEIRTAQELPFALAVSYVGYQNKEIEVYEEDEAVEFKLKSLAALNEIVVVGYGEIKRSDITGSVSSVPTELKSQPVASVERLLQGSVAGAVVTQTSGQPGGGVTVQIRGNNSITAASDPLYVIDGFPVNNDYGLTDASVTDGPKINPLSSINTSDIESIDVLKDASATAIYGSRGANGVVMITTKKAKKNHSSITYDAYYGQQSVAKQLDLLNAEEWWQLRKDAAANSDRSGATAAANKNLLQQAKANGYTIDTVGEGTDWQDAAFRKAPIQNHSLSILHGTDKTSIALSGNYFKQDGILQNTGFTRGSIRLNADYDYSKRLKFATNITASSIKADVAPAAIVGNTLQTPPALPIYKDDGSFLIRSPFESALQNPINSLYNQTNQTRTNRFLGNLSADYTIIEGLTARILVGADLVDNKQNRYLPKSTAEGESVSGQATVGSVFTTNWLNENTLTYEKRINRLHHLNALAGFTAQSSKTEGSFGSSSGFAFDELTYNSLGDGSVALQPGSFGNSWSLASYLGRVFYGYNDKYLITGTVRADGSSRFGQNNKWGVFPSMAIGWNINKESFLVDAKKLSVLKLRASAGLTGNQGINPYSSLAQLSPWRYNFSNTTVIGYAPITANNPQLGWEKTFQVDVGLDVGLFNNRVTVVADLYHKKTTDLLLSAPVSGTSGLAMPNGGQGSTIYQNIGAVQNRGFELAVNTQNVVGKKFGWNTIFIYSINRNKVLEIAPGINEIIPSISQPSILKVGYAVGSFIVYQTDGLIQPGEEGPGALTPQANKKVGGQKYRDLNGDGQITQADDRIVIDNQPGFVVGFTNNFNYKFPIGTFDLTVFLQGQSGGKIYNQNRGLLELGTGYVNASSVLLDRYSPSNTDTDVKAPYQNPSIDISDRFIEDASYIRLKNISFGYTLPSAWTSKAKITNLRFYVSVQNWWTWTKYTGYDPEVSFSGQSLINKGIDQGVYPNSKTILGGVSLSF